MKTIIQKAMGGITNVSDPYEMDNIGANEASDLNPKMYINPDPMNKGIGSVGGVGDQQGMPIGVQQQGGLPQPKIQPQQPQQTEGNMLNMTPQGRAMGAMQQQAGGMKKGGGVKQTHEIVHAKTGKLVSKFNSLKEALAHHIQMDEKKDHIIREVPKMAKSIDIMKIEILNKKGKK